MKSTIKQKLAACAGVLGLSACLSITPVFAQAQDGLLHSEILSEIIEGAGADLSPEAQTNIVRCLTRARITYQDNMNACFQLPRGAQECRDAVNRALDADIAACLHQLDFPTDEPAIIPLPPVSRTPSRGPYWE